MLGIGFGLPDILGIEYFARTGDVWAFARFSTYGGGSFESVGIATSVPLLIGFLVM